MEATMRKRVNKALVTLACLFGLQGSPAIAGGADIVYAGDDRIIDIYVSPLGSVLSFPVKPSHVVLGREGNFDIDYIERDIAIAPLNNHAQSNLFVYSQGRRYSFRLQVNARRAQDVVRVRDTTEPKESRP